MAEPSSQFSSRLGQLATDGFFDDPAPQSSFDFDKFAKQCGDFYQLLRENPARTIPAVMQSECTVPYL